MTATVHYLGIPDELMQKLKETASVLAKFTDHQTGGHVGTRLKFEAKTGLETEDMPDFKAFMDAFVAVFLNGSGLNSRAISSISNRVDRGVLFLGVKDSTSAGRRSLVIRVLIDTATFQVALNTQMVSVMVDAHPPQLRVSSQT